MRGALSTIAAILLNLDEADGTVFPWYLVRYKHCQAVRTVLTQRYSPSTANEMLSALRGVLRESWRLGPDVAAFDPETHALTVSGKGGKTRVVYVENGALNVLTDWLSIQGSWAGPLFVAFRRGDHMQDSGMSTTAIHTMMKKRSKQAAQGSSHPTICGARLPAICSTPGPTLPRCRR